MDSHATKAIPKTKSSTNVEQDGTGIDRVTSLVLQELVNSAQRDIEMGCLQTAISSLQGVLDKGAYTGKNLARVKLILVKALLTRYGLHGWIGDVDMCFQYMEEYLDDGSIYDYTSQRKNESILEARIAARLIQVCRNSIDIVTLNAIICVAARVIKDTPSANLLAILGRALVMRYLRQGTVADLDQATARFQQLERSSRGDSSLICLSSTSLAYIEWLRFVESGEDEALLRLGQYTVKAMEADAGKKSYNIGMKMVEAGVAGAPTLGEGIEFLTVALKNRTGLHPRRVVTLQNLSLALLTRFQKHGPPEDLKECIRLQREALDLVPAPHPIRAASLGNMASALFTCYEQEGELQDLEDCILCHREALHLLPALHPDRSSWLNNLASALSSRFQKKGAIKDLDESIMFHREALRFRSSPHPSRASSLDNLASELLTRSESSEGPENLEEVIALAREALSLRSAEHPDRCPSLTTLASALYARFEQKGTYQDLEEAILHRQEALVLRPAPHPDRSTSLSHLASALSMRFQQQGTFQDLENSIALHREALHLLPASHPNRSSSLHGLAMALFTHFESKGAFQDLEECIALYREALHILAVSYPRRSLWLNGLANALLTRFKQRTRRSEDLRECIGLYREALDLQSAPHPDRSLTLNNLGSAYSTLFEHGSVLLDLEESIILYREALDRLPAPHPTRSLALNNLANALSARYKQTGAFQDLDECIVLHHEALDLLPAPHPGRYTSLNNLATAFSERFKLKKAFHDSIPSFPSSADDLTNILRPLIGDPLDDSDIENALRYYEEASRYQTGPLPDRLDSSKDWAACSEAFRPALALNAHHFAITLLPILASLDLTLNQRQDVLERARGIVGNAAKCAIGAGRFDLAVVFLSTGRSIFWSQALQLRTPADQLAVTHPSLAETFTTLSQQLEQASQPALRADLGITNSAGIIADKSSSLYELVSRRDQIIEDIRKISGYEGFMKPPSFLSLQSAATKGPIIFLTASKTECDALIMHSTTVEHVPLSGIRMDELEGLTSLLRILLQGGMRSIATSDSKDTFNVLRTLSGRDMVRDDSQNSDQDTFRIFLECLWVKVVRPVVTTLRRNKTDPLRRIWWCPTGPFASLPIHAAGIYSDKNEPIDCLFQYAVSSYCSSPQDLLHPSPSVTKEFKITAIIEPDAPGAAVLPATREELRKIVMHLPGQQHLIARVGSKNSPNRIEDLMSDIKQSSLVHFGCHGTQSLSDPLKSCLLLSGGRLTMAEIIKKCQVPEGALAYLSACETAKGDEVRPDESLNLVATMMFAGFRSVIGTLWSILDDDAPIVADVFYRHLFRSGMNAPPDVRDAAFGLHLATKELRERGKTFHSWVPYVHYGI